MNSPENKPRILLVDDEPQLLAGLQIHLRRAYSVMTATNGSEALEMIEDQGPFAVIVSDMRMPGMNGTEFLRRAAAAAPMTTRVLLTGYADVESAIGAVNEGRIFRFLTKPCPPPQLLAALADAVRQYESAQEEQAFMRGERHRVSEKVLKAGRMATVGTLAAGAGKKLRDLAQGHGRVLDTVVARAATGGFVAVEDLEALRDLETDLLRAAKCLTQLAPSEAGCRELDVRVIANESVEFVRALTGADVEIVTDFDEGLPAVVADPDQLEHALMNLLTNSLDALADAKGPRKIGVRVRFDRDREEVVCEVEDTGTGIHAEAKPFVLRPYFSTKKKSSTGLGLPIVVKIAESWGGRVSFDSTFGKGSTFRIHLPAVVGYDTTMQQRLEERPEVA